MVSEKEKMALGIWYDPNNDPELISERLDAGDLCFELNQTRPKDIEKRNEIIKRLLGTLPEGLELISPFSCDYGYNIKLGKNVFINLNCYLMDGGKITIGDNVFIGSYCGFYTANHALDYPSRNIGLEKALPITIGDNCWFGANVIVLPGVTIGSGCVIGAGSVVSKDIPDNSLAVGVPAKVIRKIDQTKRI